MAALFDLHKEMLMYKIVVVHRLNHGCHLFHLSLTWGKKKKSSNPNASQSLPFLACHLCISRCIFYFFLQVL